MLDASERRPDGAMAGELLGQSLEIGRRRTEWLDLYTDPIPIDSRARAGRDLVGVM
jgi:hypothetical protein